jgi:hypothetical protein
VYDGRDKQGDVRVHPSDRYCRHNYIILEVVNRLEGSIHGVFLGGGP